MSTDWTAIGVIIAGCIGAIVTVVKIMIASSESVHSKQVDRLIAAGTTNDDNAKERHNLTLEGLASLERAWKKASKKNRRKLAKVMASCAGCESPAYRRRRRSARKPKPESP